MATRKRGGFGYVPTPVEIIESRGSMTQSKAASFKDAYSFYNENFAGYVSHLVYRLFVGGYMQNQYYESIGAIAPELKAV